jgi:hypothetical protein
MDAYEAQQHERERSRRLAAQPEVNGRPEDTDRRAHERAMDEAAGLIRPLADVLDDVDRFYREYVMNEEQAIAVALHTAHTHAIEAVPADRDHCRGRATR